MKWWPTVSTCVDLRNTALQKLPIKVLSGESLEKIPYLLELGINQIHLMPVYEFEQLGKYVNYWGYGPGFYFAPKRAYAASDDPASELKDMVRECHKAGLE